MPQIRRFIQLASLVIVALTLVAAVCVPLRGSTIERDRNECGHEPGCTPAWIADSTLPAGATEVELLLVPAIIAGVLLARRPRERWAAVWSTATLFLTSWFTMLLVVPWGYRPSTTRYVTHPAADVLRWCLLASFVVHFVVLVALFFHAAGRGRATAPDGLPRATVVR